LLNALSPGRLLSLARVGEDLSDRLIILGETDHVRALLERGTLVVVPTHSSNLDSIVLGYAVHLCGIPPLLYGAGLNLFSNRLISYFMRNLGAYRVDRRKEAPLYKEVLKTYAACSLELGYHNLFFPGGTRSRSGRVEQKLKKGLLGTAIGAYVQNLVAGRDRPEIFIVPCTISYKLVLEAETLIDDHLKAVGKSRYIIDDDEFTKPRRILNFLGNLSSLDEKIIIVLGRPMDVFGNPVDEQGRSIDPRGRLVQARHYVTRNGVPTQDVQRDMEYTNECAEAIRKAYLRENVILTTNVVGRALWDLIRQRNRGVDDYRLLRTGGRLESFPMVELHHRTEQLVSQLKSSTIVPRLGTIVASGDTQEIVADALKHFSCYHTRAAALRRGDRVFHEDRNLLLFYGNRLDGYGVTLGGQHD
jgi:glycerol-3-phosphate O-acyltransferase